MSKTMNIGIDHGYYAIKTRHFSFPAGISEYSHEPYTLQNTLEYGGKFFVCGTDRQTNVDTKARIIAYDIRELGEQLMPIGMLVTLDAIFNRVIQNWKKGKPSSN